MEAEQKKYSYNKIKRTSVNFKCDICGLIFDGNDAEAQYKEHIVNCEAFDAQQIVNPPTVDIPKYISGQEDDKKEGGNTLIIPNDKKTVEDIINEMKDLAANQAHVEWHTNYVCPVCNIKSKQVDKVGKILSPETGQSMGLGNEFQFDTLEEFDHHLWQKHNLAVSREPEMKIINQKTGERVI